MSTTTSDTWIKVLEEDELKENSRKVVTHGQHQILLINHKGTLFAVNNQCPHLGFPLKTGYIDGDNCIHCPFHRSAFSLESGDVADWAPWPPGLGIMLGKLSKEEALEIYGVRIRDGGVEVNLAGPPKVEADPNATKILIPPEETTS